MSESDHFDLLTTQQLLSLPPAQWLLEGLIPTEGFAGLYGSPGSGKSFVALDWSMCISEGQAWLGVYHTRRAPVIYIAAEGGRGIQQRVWAWMRHHGKTDLPGMHWLLHPLYVREEGAVEEFLEELERIDIWPGMLVVDTLSRSFGGGEENASEDMGHFVDRITRLAQDRRMASLVVHHTNATGGRERGHTAFRGAADAMFRCEVYRTKQGHIETVSIVNDKQKDAEELAPIYIKPIAGLPSLVFEVGEAPKRAERGSGPPAPMRKRDVLTVLQAAENGYAYTEWRLACGIDKRLMSRRIRKLIAEGDVYKDEGRYYATPSNTDLTEAEDE